MSWSSVLLEINLLASAHILNSWPEKFFEHFQLILTINIFFEKVGFNDAIRWHGSPNINFRAFIPIFLDSMGVFCAPYSTILLMNPTWYMKGCFIREKMRSFNLEFYRYGSNFSELSTLKSYSPKCSRWWICILLARTPNSLRMHL